MGKFRMAAFDALAAVARADSYAKLVDLLVAATAAKQNAAAERAIVATGNRLATGRAVRPGDCRLTAKPRHRRKSRCCRTRRVRRC